MSPIPHTEFGALLAAYGPFQDGGALPLARGSTLPGGLTAALVLLLVAAACLGGAYAVKRRNRR
ncbi:hypothetical protein [Streptomyces zingiberis]|uniref:LPXTG cell wall anchor domain-containing protein n=1 Tax=Streptomyces zingiberis TaxID=2053010 RepID=A0ABX1BY54_9ACTN|nr:hypothetical protein [Streptomyces zingiberis]NJQ01218.1 hypothetical protein [Streptomyces zingiberis]